MMEIKNGWPDLPSRKIFAKDWQHSDFASMEIGATYVKKMYELAIDKGALNEK